MRRVDNAAIIPRGRVAMEKDENEAVLSAKIAAAEFRVIHVI